MPIIAEVGRKAWKTRLVIAAIYLILAIFGVTMVYPFLITLTASVSTAMDYQRFAPVPRAFWSREERFVRGIVPYFPDATLRGAIDQFDHLFLNTPPEWTAWQLAGRDPKAVDAFAKPYLALQRDSARWAQVKRMAADYDAFAADYPLHDSVCSIDEQDVARFLRGVYLHRVPVGSKREPRALALLGANWGVPYESFYLVRPMRELQYAFDQANYFPPADGRAKDFDLMWQAYRERRFLPGEIKAKLRARSTGDVAPACEVRPFPLKTVWLRYLGTPAQRTALGLPAGVGITIDEYNKAFGTDFPTLRETPFPVPPDAPATMRVLWTGFVQTLYPLRLVEVPNDPELSLRYRAFLRDRFKGDLPRCNRIGETSYRTWEEIALAPHMPEDNPAEASLWMDFIAGLPAETKILHSAEAAYQGFLIERYGSVKAVNAAYGWHLKRITEAQMPFDMAYLVTFVENEGPLFRASLAKNYRFVVDYLLLRGRAVANMVILIALTLLAALTINPLAAYALSRFQMKQTPAVILFMLATMAFPAAVSMIPNYLLMRDLHMLNTYWALILPGIANGMSIFLLKGFFDSLPPELYEAAALDGAKEWQVFLRITLPLSKPILAVIALNSFMAAYNSWEWALVVCQKQSMWTMAVWLYQFNSTWSTQSWAVMASFVVASLPVFLVFVLCQNIILRGIILPQMK
jgi:ABC-type glycerol-3-phosphate transport system permease component